MFLIVFGSFWGAILEHFGRPNRPKLGQVGFKMALETIFFEKSEFSRKALKTNEKSTFLSPRAATKRPKIAPRRPQDDLEEVFFSHRFLSSILVGFGFDFGSLWAPFWEPKSVILGIDFLMIFACRSKIAPRAAKSGPRAAQEWPRALQERPRAAQSAPRGP